MKHWMRRNRVCMAPEGEGGASGAPAPTPAPASTGDDPNTLLQQGTEFIPEKFRVSKADGSLDLDASARKLAGSYAELEKSRPAGHVPKTAEEYQIEAPKGADGKPVEGIDFAQFTADPMFKDFTAQALAKGLTNEQLQFVTDHYLTKIAPAMVGAMAAADATEARAALTKLWGNDQALTQNLTLANRAVRGFGSEGDVPGGLDRLMSKYGNDPDFLAFAAAVGKEMQEDTAVTGAGASGEDWDSRVSALRANPAYSDANHLDHAKVVGQVQALYEQRYGKKTQRLTGGAVR